MDSIAGISVTPAAFPAMRQPAVVSCCLAHPTEALESGIAQGQLGGSVAAPVVLAQDPPRSLLLAAMRQRGILLPCYDCIIDKEGKSAPIKTVWREMHAVGGADKVRGRRERGAAGQMGGTPWGSLCEGPGCC